MLLLKKHKSPKQSASQQKIVEKIISRWIQIKQKWSLYLQSKTAPYSLQSKRTGLAVFCILFGGLSIYIIINSFIDNNNNLLSIHHITMPAHINQSGDERLNNDNIISRQEYEHIQAFKHYMDSLQSNSEGKIIYESIMQARPHLIDSIHLVENMYQSQSK